MPDTTHTDAPTGEATEARPADATGDTVEAPKEPRQTFDADYVDKLRRENAKYRTAAKANADDAQKWRDSVEASKTEAQRQSEHIDRLTATNRTLEAELARLRAATTHHIDADYLDLLGDGTAEELDDRATKLADLLAARQERDALKATQRRPASSMPVTGLTAGATDTRPADDAYPPSWNPRKEH